MSQPNFSAVRWTILTAIGLAGGLTAGVLAGMPLGQILNAMLSTLLTVVTVGAVLGMFQAAGLRPLVTKRAWWVAATVAGVVIGLALAVVIVEQTGIFLTGVRPRVAYLTPSMRALSFVTIGLVAGTILGFAQSLVLRRQRAAVRYWAIATGAALAVAFSVASLLVDAAGVVYPSVAGRIVFVLLAGLFFGALTSMPLSRLARCASASSSP